MPHPRRIPVALFALLVAGCGGDSGPSLFAPDDAACDPLVPAFCAYPFPNDFYTVADATSPTGRRVAFPEGAYALFDPSALAASDGFSAGQTLLFQLGLATDTGFPTPTNEGIALSLTDASPTVLMNALTGERVPHFAERDHRADDPAERALTIRPVVRLEDGTRYLVAVRGAVDEAGVEVEPAPAFLALRDGVPSEDPRVEARRARFEEHFALLEAEGIPRATLQLVWDFTTASDANNTAWLLHMRDEALSLVDPVTGPEYTITSVEATDCAGISAPCAPFADASWSDHVAFKVVGTFRAPSYMDVQAAGGHLLFGADGLPEINATDPWHDVPFEVLIPNAALSVPAPLLQFGHGLFGEKEQIEASHLRAWIDTYGYVLFAADLDGMASEDYAAVAAPLTSADPSGIRVMFDRLHQGFLQWVLLMDLMQKGLAADPDFGAYLDPTRRYYHGISQGGIMGGVYAAISPHLARAALGVAGQPYSLLLFRSVDFIPFFALLQLGHPDARGQQLLVSIAQMMWDRVEPNGYSHHLRPGYALPGATVDGVLLRDALGDHQVSTLGAAVMARAMGAERLDTALRDVWGLPAVAAVLSGNGMSEYAFGNPVEPPCNVPPVHLDEPSVGLCEDPHGKLRKLASAEAQLDHFLRTGEVRNFCPDGLAESPGASCDYPSMASCAPGEDDEAALALCGL